MRLAPIVWGSGLPVPHEIFRKKENLCVAMSDNKHENHPNKSLATVKWMCSSPSEVACQGLPGLAVLLLVTAITRVDSVECLA